MELTSTDKVLWPATGFTKGDMLDYYRRVAPALLPHVAGRPLTLGRFPSGVDGPGFASTECRGRPDWLPTRRIRLRSGELRDYCVANDERSLLWVANQNAIELHTFLARGDDLERAPVLLLDLDPASGAGLLDCCRVALWLRATLDSRGRACHAKTSGSFGLHVYVPLDGAHGYAETRAFAREIAESLPADEAGRMTIDWRRNAPRATLIAPYSLRAMDRPAVATPVTWEEIEAALAAGDERLLSFGPADVLDRLERLGDPLAPVLA